MPFNNIGSMVITALTAGGALPVEGTVVKITGVDEENRTVEYSLITDKDGITEKISLPAPSRNLSLSPGAAEQPYAQYNVEISAPGFYTKRLFGVAVFEGTETLQQVNMIPLPDKETGVSYPRNNLNTVVRENERLE